MHSESSTQPHELDILFISYSESNADKNWLELKTRFPRSKRVHGVKGIREAHQQAALRSDTEFFFVVDGDNRIVPTFSFERPQQDLDTETLYVYRCLNPLNELIYGFGAVKIYNKTMLLSTSCETYVDLATSICKKYKIINDVASETYFFHTPIEAWRGSFRECFKLASETKTGKVSDQALKRLMIWCDFHSDLKNAKWALLGAKQGRELALSGSREYCRVNDFDWLEGYFNDYAN